jgi:hypothetical protein
MHRVRAAAVSAGSPSIASDGTLTCGRRVPTRTRHGIVRLQGRRCGETGGRLWKNAEVDHRVPLFRVWSEHRDDPWPHLLDFWGLPNLQVINRDVHVAKCAVEAGGRRAAPASASETTGQDAAGGSS